METIDQKIVIQIYFPNDNGEWDGEDIISLRDVTKELSKAAPIVLRILTQNCSEELEKELKNIQYKNINFLCGLENSIPFLYTGSEVGAAIYKQMEKHVEDFEYKKAASDIIHFTYLIDKQVNN